MTNSKKTAGVKVDEKVKNLEEQLKRALADYANLEKRFEEERKMFSTLHNMIIIEKFLPVLDNLESAQAHVKDEGLQMVLKQFKDVLDQEGVEEITTEGTGFDPNLHEAVETTQGEENKIVNTIAKGYKIDGKVIRPAKVVVGKNQPQPGKKEEQTQTES